MQLMLITNPLIGIYCIHCVYNWWIRLRHARNWQLGIKKNEEIALKCIPYLKRAGRGQATESVL